MKRLKILGFASALVASAVVGGTLISTVLANPGTAPSTATANGGGLAVDAKTGQYCQTFLDEFAKQLGVSESALTPAAKAAADAAIDKAIANGDLPKAIGDAMKKRIANANGDGCALFGARFRHVFKNTLKTGIRMDLGQAAASSLHLTVDQLKAKLKSGESLKDIAKDQNVDYATVTAAIESAAKTDLDKLVKAGTITQERENTMLERLDQALKNGKLFGGARNKSNAPSGPASSPSGATSSSS
jgi:uncharacterized protein YidB (DUF937 family)